MLTYRPLDHLITRNVRKGRVQGDTLIGSVYRWWQGRTRDTSSAYLNGLIDLPQIRFHHAEPILCILPPQTGLPRSW